MISKDVSVGIVLMYNGTGIGVGNGSGSTDPEKRYNRTDEISESNGDSFDMIGWYICNGQVSGVPDLVEAYDSGKFPRGANDSGSNQSGGDDDAVMVDHNHGTNSGYGGIHNHGGTLASPGTHKHVMTNITNMIATTTGWFLFGNTDNTVKSGVSCESTRESYGDHSHTLQTGSSAHSHSTTSTGSESRTDRNMSVYHSVIPIIRKD